jgi:EmrB/QacA subfamily drug resistance transporter
MQPPPTRPGTDYSRKWWVMLAIAMGVFLGTIDGSIVNVALPTLIRDLHTTFPHAQWVVLSYLLTLATLVLGVGRLGDVVGKKTIYTAGFGVFTLGSVLAGLSPSIGWLIGFRVFQAVGASMVFALGFALVTEAFPPEERGRALGIQGAIVSAGIVLGPTLGGMLIDSFGWRSIFFVNLPVGIVGTWCAARFIPDTPPVGGQRFDFAGAALLFAALLALMLGLTLGQTRGFSDPLVGGLVAGSALMIAGFIAVERRSPQPMLDLRLFHNRQFSANIFAGWASFAGIGGVYLLLPFYLESVLGHTPREAGLLLASGPAALGVAAPIAGVVSDRVGPHPVVVTGLSVLAVGYLLMTRLGLTTAPLEYVLLGIPVGLGLGIFQSPNNSAIMGAVPRDRLGVTSGLLTITRITGQLSGISLLGTVWAARVAAHTGTVSTPTAAPPAAQVSALRDTLFGVAALIGIALLLTTRSIRRSGATADGGV